MHEDSGALAQCSCNGKMGKVVRLAVSVLVALALASCVVGNAYAEEQGSGSKEGQLSALEAAAEEMNEADAASGESDDESLDAEESEDADAQDAFAASAESAPLDIEADDEGATEPEGPAGYTGWVVEDRGTGEGLQRYWLENGVTATSRLISPADGAGWWAYATASGAVVRGAYDAGNGYVYVADNDGRLPSSDGWLVTGDYTDGDLQRYWIENHAARSSYFEVDGSRYFGLGGLGYVVRGAGTGVDGSGLYADNDGKLVSSTWVVTDGFGDGTQRYWFGSDCAMARSRLIDPAEGCGWWAYATSSGYVVRGAHDAGNGYVYVADNDGRLPNTEGWLITGDYTGGSLERYWIENHAARSSLFEVDGSWYFGKGGVGYVVRGTYDAGNGYVYVADNDGRLPNTEGWLITGDYTGGSLERYWIENHAARSSLFEVDGSWYFGKGGVGYVVRGTYDAGNGYVYLADNDGRLPSTEGWLISGDYTGGSLERYWIEDHAARSGFFDAEGSSYYGIGGQGYVLRGKCTFSDHILLADNDGRLNQASGWLVTDAYDGTMQRYYMEACYQNYTGAKLGYFTVDGSQYYAYYDQGYVRRNDTWSANGKWWYANNDGVMTETTPPYQAAMFYAAQQYYSSTNYLVMVDNQNCYVGIFTGSQGNWNLVKLFRCSNGAGGASLVGSYTMGSKIYSFGDSTHTCFYASQISGNYLFHTVLYAPYESRPTTVINSTLGAHISNGCIRLATDDAYWMYVNVPSGTKIVLSSYSGW